MKISPVIIAFLFLVTPLLAQQSENTAPSEVSQLRQSYIASLKTLLERYVKENDVVAAATVSQELDKVVPATPDTAPRTSPFGTWRWPGGSTTTIAADGIATNVENKGLWHWIDQSNRKLQIEWKNGYKDTLTVAPDGTLLLGINVFDQKFVAYRLSLEKTTKVALQR